MSDTCNRNERSVYYDGLRKEKQPAELDELEMISGGEYGDLLRLILTTYKAICSCGYQETVKNGCYGRVVCPQCNQLITNYEEE